MFKFVGMSSKKKLTSQILKGTPFVLWYCWLFNHSSYSNFFVNIKIFMSCLKTFDDKLNHNKINNNYIIFLKKTNDQMLVKRLTTSYIKIRIRRDTILYLRMEGLAGWLFELLEWPMKLCFQTSICVDLDTSNRSNISRYSTPELDDD